MLRCLLERSVMLLAVALLLAAIIACSLRFATPAVQFYALGVPSDGALDVYVGVTAPPERLPALASGAVRCNADQIAARVAEAVVLESLIHWQRKANLVWTPKAAVFSAFIPFFSHSSTSPQEWLRFWEMLGSTLHGS